MNGKFEQSLKDWKLNTLSYGKPVYTKRQRQLRVNATMTLAARLSLATTESLENGLQPPF